MVESKSMGQKKVRKSMKSFLDCRVNTNLLLGIRLSFIPFPRDIPASGSHLTQEGYCVESGLGIS